MVSTRRLLVGVANNGHCCMEFACLHGFISLIGDSKLVCVCERVNGVCVSCDGLATFSRVYSLPFALLYCRCTGDTDQQTPTTL